MMISFVVTTRNEGTWLQYTVDQLLRDKRPGDEVVIVDDGSTDGSTAGLQAKAQRDLRLLSSHGLGVARARNAGALEARGEILIFLDAHMRLTAGWYLPLLELLRDPTSGAVQPAIANMHRPDAIGYGERFRSADLTLEWLPRQHQEPYTVPILCGCCFAVWRHIFLHIGGLDGGMIGWGSEDCEFSLRLWRLGYQVWIDPMVVVGHLFRESAPYHIDWHVVLHNRLRMALAHFSPSRLRRVLRSLQALPCFDEAYAAVTHSDIHASRLWLERNSVFDDDYFLQYSGKHF